MKKLRKLLSYFKYIYLFEYNGRQFYYRSKIGSVGYEFYMRNIEIYDTSIYGNHKWNYISIGAQSTEFKGVIKFIHDQREDFFKYKTIGRTCRGCR